MSKFFKLTFSLVKAVSVKNLTWKQLMLTVAM
jgi:hypothetical protein